MINLTTCRKWTKRGIPALALPILLLADQASALPIIDPAGVTYTSVASSSQLEGQGATNLFNRDLTGLTAGSTIVAGDEYANTGTGSAYVTFTMDQTYTVGSIWYAQRANAVGLTNSVTDIYVYGRDSAPYPLTNPGADADLHVTGIDTTPLVWKEYLLPVPVTGKHFSIRFRVLGRPGDPATSGNKGGAAFRLGLAPSNPAIALDVLDPSGTNYSNVSASSTFGGTWVSSRLFDYDMSNVPLGGKSDSLEWAKSEGGEAYVAFQLDKVYNDIGSVFYAQRDGGDQLGDKYDIVSLWASTDTAFATANPGRCADAIFAITNKTGKVWAEYVSNFRISGRYFLARFEQKTYAGVGNPGGKEFRLGKSPDPVPPVITQNPVNKTVYVGGAARFTVAATGPKPYGYQWKKGGFPLTDGGNISGANSATLIISGVANGDAGSYSCTVTNVFGQALSTSASLAIGPAPTTPLALAMRSSSATAYWQLNEAPGATIAADLAGGNDGTYGTASGLGVAGPQAPAFPGFSSANTAVQTYPFQTASDVALPPLRLNGSNITIMAWINPSSSEGPQNPYCGIVFSRDAGTVAGLIYSEDGTKLAYQWNGNRYTFDSALVVPNDQWSLVALVVTPTNAVLYCGANNVMKSAIDIVNQPAQTFSGATYIGLDWNNGTTARTFNGAVDDVAFFDRALSPEEVNSLYQVGAGVLLPWAVEIISQPVGQTLHYGDNLSLNVVAMGTPPITYQWYKTGALIANGTNSTYAVTAKPSDAGDYQVIVSNGAGKATSSVAVVTVATNMLRILSPTGTKYTQVTSDRFFASGWEAVNMFKTDVTSLKSGDVMTTEGGGNEFARSGGGDAWVAFQVDQIYTMGAVYWAQRNGSGTGDNMQVMSLWASSTTPFTTVDPGTAPDAVVSLLPNSGNAVWMGYDLTNTITGRYFLMRLSQTTVTGNPGGAEMRFAVTGMPEAVRVTSSASGPVMSWPTFGTLLQADNVNGPWVPATGVVNGAPVPATAAQKFYRVSY